MEAVEVNSINSRIGQQIRSARKHYEEDGKRGLTQAELAALLGVDNTTVAHWEKGTHPISVEVLQKLTFIFRVSADYFLGSREERKNEGLFFGFMTLLHSMSEQPDNRIQEIANVVNGFDLSKLSDLEFHLILEYIKMILKMDLQGNYYSEEEVEEERQASYDSGLEDGVDRLSPQDLVDELQARDYDP